MGKFKKWLEEGNQFFDNEIEITPLDENKLRLQDIYSSNVVTPKQKQAIVHNITTRNSVISLVFSVLTFVIYLGLLIASTTFLPEFGDSNLTWNYVSRYYIENALADTKSVNAVTGMILDYRAFDTLGESFVLFSGVTCVLILLRGLKDDSLPVKHGFVVDKDPIVRYVAGFVIPIVFIFGVYVVLNGHLSPGGGFSGGAILGAGFILYSLAFGEEAAGKFFTIKTFKTVSAIALLGYASTKCYSFLMGGMHFNDPIHHFFHSLADGSILSGGYILILNICVGAVVASTMYGLYCLFKKGEI